MREWLDSFYASPTTHEGVLASIRPVFEKYAAAAWEGDGEAPAAFVDSLSETYVDHHLDSSRAQLQELLSSEDPKAAIQGRIAEWVEKRPGKVASNETVRIANALALEAMRAAGATEKVWVVSGTCAFCKKMAGKRAALNEPFISADDEVAPDGEKPMRVRSNVGHPPLHQGCQCSIEPDSFFAPDSPEGRAVDRRQFRPDADPNATPRTDPQAYWDEMDAVATELDQMGYRSSWSGRFDTVGGGRGHYDDLDDTIRMDLNGQRADGPRWHNMVHELIHGITPGGHGAYGRGTPYGWEEGPTDMLANILGPRVRGVLNLTAEQEAAAVRYGSTNAYAPYREGMERIRALSGMEPAEFYQKLMETPLADRPYFIIRGLGLDQATVQSISDQFLADKI